MHTNLTTPGAVLDLWIGPASHDAIAAKARQKLWFRKSFATDTRLAEQFIPLIAALRSGLGLEWAAQGPRQRLAAIIALDQFSRNIFRGHALSFAHDRLALALCKEGMIMEVDSELTEMEKVFFYLPLEHSEHMADQDLCVAQYEALLRTGRPAFHDQLKGTLDFAEKHRDVIREFGRFPHRNAILKRPSTASEQAYLAKPGSGF